MKNLLLFSFFFLSLNCISQQLVIDTNQLIDETQLSGSDPDEMKLVWWIPIEFWESVFAGDNTVTDDQAQNMLDVLSEYTMFAVVDGTIGPFGGVSFEPLETFENKVFVVDMNQEKYAPIKTEKLNSDTQILISSFKPILKNMLGAMGENMHFFVFSDLSKKKERICDPRAKGQVIFEMKGETYSYRTPLGAVLPPKKCPKDDEEMSGAWDYCPWHGNALDLKTGK